MATQNPSDPGVQNDAVSSSAVPETPAPFTCQAFPQPVKPAEAIPVRSKIFRPPSGRALKDVVLEADKRSCARKALPMDRLNVRLSRQTDTFALSLQGNRRSPRC